MMENTQNHPRVAFPVLFIVFFLRNGVSFARFFLLSPTIMGLFGFQIVVTPPVLLYGTAGEDLTGIIFMDHIDLTPMIPGLIAAANAVMGSVVMGDMNEAILICGDDIFTYAVSMLIPYRLC